MEIIKCTSYEKREFIRILEYAKEMKMNTKIKQGKFDDTLYDVQQIELLIKRVKGVAPKEAYIKDSLGWTHETKKDQETQYYKHEYYNNIVKGKKK